MADMLGHSCQSALFFRDPAEAARTLKSLAAEPDVVRAWILDGEGGVFAEYGKSVPGESPPSGKGENEIRRGRTLTLSRLIVQDGERAGTIVLRYDLGRYRAGLLSTHATSLLALVIGLGVALLLALLAQRSLSTPILRLVEVLGHVSRTNDLSIRLPDPRRDEIGVLYRGFNAMLTMISNREKDRDAAEAALRESESKYRTLVENAKDGIVILQDSRFVYANPSLVDMSGKHAGGAARHALPAARGRGGEGEAGLLLRKPAAGRRLDVDVRDRLPDQVRPAHPGRGQRRRHPLPRPHGRPGRHPEHQRAEEDRGRDPGPQRKPRAARPGEDARAGRGQRAPDRAGPSQEPVPGLDESRAAHPAQLHPGVHRPSADGAVRPAERRTKPAAGHGRE